MFFKKSKVLDLRFVDTSGRGLYQTLPVRKAEDVPYVCEEYQKEKYKTKKFHLCPGMSDYAKLGFIIPAWTDIEIFANKAGITASRGLTQTGSRVVEIGNPPVRMGGDIPDGLVSIDPEIPFAVYKFENPWNIFCSKNISALIMPPIYHATWCNDVHMYPGCISYSKFTFANIMLTIKKPMRVKISAGEPLVHVIPFYDKNIDAGFGPATEEDLHYSKGQIYGTEHQFYRKKLNIKKIFNLFK